MSGTTVSPVFGLFFFCIIHMDPRLKDGSKVPQDSADIGKKWLVK
jgi:hypothetical protein